MIASTTVTKTCPAVSVFGKAKSTRGFPVCNAFQGSWRPGADLPKRMYWYLLDVLVAMGGFRLIVGGGGDGWISSGMTRFGVVLISDRGWVGWGCCWFGRGDVWCGERMDGCP